jgi:hypothetical protein
VAGYVSDWRVDPNQTPDAAISVPNPSSILVDAGSTGSSLLTITANESYNSSEMDAVTVYVSGVPAGSSWYWDNRGTNQTGSYSMYENQQATLTSLERP